MPLSYLISGGHSYNTNVGKIIIKLIRKIERRFFDKHFGMWCHKCLKEWFDYMHKMKTRRHNAAIKIQNCWRRHQGIGTYLKKKL